MLLAIDIGNTNIVIGIINNGNIIDSWRIGTDKLKTSNEYGILITNLINFHNVDKNEISHSIISCVVPSLQTVIIECVKIYFGCFPILVGQGIKTGMPILYKNPQEVGADRIVNAIAAYEEYRCSLIVVDFGTATTFDCISDNGEYLGGAIAPGLLISSEALFGSASKLPKVEIAKPDSVIGKTTVQSIRSGLVFGYAALVDGLVERIKTDLGRKTKVIATGGLAKLISSESRTIESIDEDLALKGLWILHVRNS